ncbi:MAG TPA: tyrosine-type recombinase/integrase, partial [Candidatus Micrarchaeia archaeon]|nr:tyrosine-type recombinase/integrase [Candidatus Micrarchaeia archaeon]
ALQRVDGRLQLVETKSASSRRMIPMASALAAILTAHRAAQAAASLAAGSAWAPTISDLCFATANGAPRDGAVVTHAFHGRLREAACPDRRFHDLRHGAATLLLAAGSDLKTVSTILGHSQISLTANTYAAVLPALTGAAVGRLDALLRADSDAGGGKVGGKDSAVA